MDTQIQTISEWLGSGSLNIFGRPFAGKDTQGRYLADAFDGVMLSGGDILRHNRDNPEIQRIMASGGIIPSDLFESIVIPYLSNPDFAHRPLILSEVGRLIEEAKVVMSAATQTGHPLKVVLYLDLPESEVWNRFITSQVSGDRGQRADDNRDVLQTRLDKYRDLVLPVIEYYRSLDLVLDIDGTLSRDEVTAQIIRGLYERCKKS